MFGASSSLAPTVQLRRSSAPAVERPTVTTSTAASGAAGSFTSRASVMSAVAVAAGASAVIGGRLLYAAATSPLSSSSWWSRLAQRVPLLGRRASAADDEDDDFATGTGAANLFDAGKSKARQERQRGTAKGTGPTRRLANGGTAAAVASALAAPNGSAASSEPASKTTATAAAADVGEAKDMAEREQHLKLIRALLERTAGITYDDEEDSSSSSSACTDVSLNYHLATAMEANARDELLMAFATFEEASGGDVYGSPLPAAGNPEAAELQANIIVRILEYLDMSSEREKLRQRRIALYHADGRPTPVSSVDLDEDHDGREEEEDEEEGGVMNALYHRFAAEYAGGPHGRDEDDEDGVDYGDYPSAMERQARRFESLMLGSDMSRPNVAQPGRGILDDGSVLNRILGQRSAGAPTLPSMMPARNGTGARRRDGGDEDMMEDGWAEAEDDAEEAEFMAYLQQQNDAPHFYSREGMRQARRDPGNDVRVVGMDDDDLFGGADAADWEDAEGGEEEEEDEEEEDEEDEEGVAIPWSRRDKADFERELFARIRHLAARTALTVDMAERVVEAADARREETRAQRRQRGAAQPPQTPPAEAAAGERATPTKAAAAPKESDAGDAAANEEDEWEDEADWEDA